MIIEILLRGGAMKFKLGGVGLKMTSIIYQYPIYMGRGCAKML